MHHSHLLKTNEVLVETLFTSLGDVNQQLDALDGRLYTFQQDDLQPFTLQAQMGKEEQARTELMLLRSSLEQNLLTLNQQQSRLLLQAHHWALKILLPRHLSS